jgi:MarR family transcriptional regulator, lower aerobic nicotinate degradation pathway regulator
VVRTAAPVDRRSVRVAITNAGRELIDQGAAAFESEIAVLVADLTPDQRARLSQIASRVVAADARRRGIDIFATQA